MQWSLQGLGGSLALWKSEITVVILRLNNMSYKNKNYQYTHETLQGKHVKECCLKRKCFLPWYWWSWVSTCLCEQQGTPFTLAQGSLGSGSLRGPAAEIHKKHATPRGKTWKNIVERYRPCYVKAKGLLRISLSRISLVLLHCATRG